MRSRLCTLLTGAALAALAGQASAADFGSSVGDSVEKCWTRYTSDHDVPVLLVGVTLGATSCTPLAVAGTAAHAVDPGTSEPETPVRGATGLADAVGGNWHRERQDLGPVAAFLFSPVWVIQSLSTPTH